MSSFIGRFPTFCNEIGVTSKTTTDCQPARSARMASRSKDSEYHPEALDRDALQ